MDIGKLDEQPGQRAGAVQKLLLRVGAVLAPVEAVPHVVGFLRRFWDRRSFAFATKLVSRDSLAKKKIFLFF